LQLLFGKKSQNCKLPATIDNRDKKAESLSPRNLKNIYFDVGFNQFKNNQI